VNGAKESVLEALLERFRAGDRLALSRLLTIAARGQNLDWIVAHLPEHAPSRFVAVTGSAGVGKSTLIGKLIETIRKDGRTVAVLACDPQSPLSGGALLGDRFRMPTLPDDDGSFIRSLATPGGHGAVVEHIDVLAKILQSFGFQIILLETVGAGQGDTAVHDLADVVVLLLQPETGDDLQWEKAGLLEVADIVAIHKADLPGAERVEAQVRAALDPSDAHPVKILRVSSKNGSGVAELWKAIAASPLRLPNRAANGEDLLHLAQANLASRFALARSRGDTELANLLLSWQTHRIDGSEATRRIIQLLAAMPLSENES
jgi:LAO/AO transport system ATPase